MAKRDTSSSGLTYVGAPYSHEDKEVVAKRMEIFKKCVAAISMKHNVVSPLFMHDVLQYNPDLGSDWDFWKEYGSWMMMKSDRLIIICLPGWTSSTGIKDEIELAKKRGIPIGFAEVNGDEIGEIMWQTPSPISIPR